MKPNDQRGFIHGKIISIGKSFLPGPVRFGLDLVSSRRRGGQPVAPAASSAVDPRFLTPLARKLDIAGHIAHGHIPFTSTGHTSLDSQLPGFAGPCVGAGCNGSSEFVGGGGASVQGRYGPAMQPMLQNRTIRHCLPGDILGDDGLCYGKSQITNKEREHPRGRRPLGTPGEMAALAKAASFGRRMETTVKRMQKIGVLKKPTRAKRFSPPHRQRQIGPGPSIINVE